MPGTSPGMTVVRNNRGRGHSFTSSRSLLLVQPLLLVADAIDRTGPVVGNEDRAILVEDDVGGAAEIALVAFEPAGSKHLLLGILAVRTDVDAHDPRALVLMPVPGALFGDHDHCLVLG